ncbi:MAG: HAD family hydrolase [Actinomycetota bacterium]|nr:HAD family hydrolase [Actinomycetota bacterium]
MPNHLDVVFLDVGGPIYGDRPYYEGLFAAIRERRTDASEDEYWAEFRACRRDQRGPFTRRLTLRFLPEDEYEGVVARGRELWRYPPESLQPDVKEALPALARDYRLGVLANQERWIRDTMRRDGLDGYFDVWAVSAELGVEKPEPGIFEHALRQAGVGPERAVMVGDRLDNDIAAAKRVGLHTVWMLRGEAPDDPTDEQLAVPDAAVRTLRGLPGVLRDLVT